MAYFYIKSAFLTSKNGLFGSRVLFSEMMPSAADDDISTYHVKLVNLILH